MPNPSAPTCYISADGAALGTLPDFARDRDGLVCLYEAMVLTRRFDEKAIALQRTGRLGTYGSSLGQEAISVGAAAAMRAEDVFLPSFREHGGQLLRGVTPRELFLYWGGDERGSDFAGPREDFPDCVPVASHFPHAAGVAFAFQLRGETRAAVAIGGDGATSKGDFYEALNVAGVWRLPLVVVVNNNQWAISVRRVDQTAARTLADKAAAAGIPGEQVDGNDVVAVRARVAAALERAYAGDGPTLIEAVSYRLGDHTTADDASRYRDEEEVSPHWKEEPIGRLRAHLVGAHDWSKEDEQRVWDEATARIEEEAEAYLATDPQAPAAMFDYLHATLPDSLTEQRAATVAAAESADG